MRKLILYFFFSSISLLSFSQTDKPDCLDKTFSFFTIFDGFYLQSCESSEYGSYKFVLDQGYTPVIKEGYYRMVEIHKKADSKRTVSGLQIMRNHINAIKAVGGEISENSDEHIFKNVFRTTYNGKELWIFVAVSNISDVDYYRIYSIEVDVLKQEISAQDIKGRIASSGKIALYGILFDTGKSEIQASSEKAIGSVATYLKENPDVNVYIVGHTDNTGDYALNLKLSKARGEAVKNYLVSKYGISAARLTGDGAGSLCPVTSNDSEEGRTLNRRVEIVKK
jgi:OmpA-OmpF porin, OOP family